MFDLTNYELTRKEKGILFEIFMEELRQQKDLAPEFRVAQEGVTALQKLVIKFVSETEVLAYLSRSEKRLLGLD